MIEAKQNTLTSKQDYRVTLNIHLIKKIKNILPI